MAYLPISTEFNALYTLTAPDGSVATFNNPSDPNYVGALTELTGLDSAEVRESAQDLVEADGGAHGSFYLGRRPIVMTCRVFGHASLQEREVRVDRARRASMCLRGNGSLTWRPSDYAARAASDWMEVFTPVRRQQPFRESGQWVKELQIPLVSEYATIQSTSLITVAAGTAAENRGNWPAFPILEITGVSVNPTVVADGRTFRTTGLTLATGEKVEFDMLNHTGKFTAGPRVGQSANRHIDFTATDWPYLAGLNSVQTFSMSGGGTLSVRYRHTWA